jgi:hypothetical protein
LKKQIHHSTQHDKMRKLFFLFILNCIAINFLSGQCLEGDCMNGKGVLINPDGNFFVGTFQNGLLEGKGVCHFSWGAKYVGQWAKGSFNGEGAYYYPEGSVDSGVWENGNLIHRNLSKTTSSKFHAIVIGIGEYHNRELKYTENDAKSIYHLLTQSEFSTYGSGDIRLLLNQAATIDKLRGSIKTISEEANDEDIFMFFFFGAGQNHSFELFDGTIHFSELNGLFSNIHTAQKLSFFDLSQKTLDEELFALKTPSTSTPSMGLNSNLIYLEKTEESSIEYDGLRFGLMKHYLYQSLRGACDTNVDGEINIQEIHTYLSSKIETYTNGYLVPSLLSSELTIKKD